MVNMELLFRRVAIITTVVVSSLFLLVSPVAADSATKINLGFECVPEEIAIAINEDGCRHYCSGIIANSSAGGAEFLGLETSGIGDLVSYRCAIESGDVAGLYGGDSQPGLGAMIFNLNSLMVEQRTASGVVFALDHLERLVVPEAVYAQEEPLPYFPGTGFTLLQPIQSFWGWAVTVSLSFMVIVILVVAFALMFRAKLDGKQVVQLQSAIPGIVMAMVLIPLSYPISGLFIDAITLGTNVVHGLMFSPGGPGRTVYENGAEKLGLENPFNSDVNNGRGLYADDVRVSVFRVREFLSVSGLGDYVGNLICPEGPDPNADCGRREGLHLLAGIDALLKQVNGTPDGGINLVIGNIVVMLLSLLMIWVSIKIAWKLLQKLLLLIVLPIMSPFVFATLAIPGVGTGNVVNYLKQLGSATLAFIVTYTAFLFAIVFTNAAFFENIPGIGTIKDYSPPLLGFIPVINVNIAQTAQGIASAATSSNISTLLFTVIGLGIYLSTPKFIDQIDEQLKLEKSLIPKALKPFVDDIQDSASWAYRKAPATLGSAVRRAGAGAAWAGGKYGAYKSDPYGDSRAELSVKEVRTRIATARNVLDDKNASFVRKVQARGQIALARSVGTARTNLLGESVYAAGEESVDYTVKLEISSIPYGTELTKTTYDSYAASPQNGILTIEVPEKASPPQGKIIFNKKKRGSSGDNVIAKLSLNNTTTYAEVEITKDAWLQPYKGGSGEAVEVTNSKFFLGGNRRVIIGCQLRLKSISNPVGGWSTRSGDKGLPIEIIIGGKKKRVDYEFRVSG